MTKYGWPAELFGSCVGVKAATAQGHIYANPDVPTNWIIVPDTAMTYYNTTAASSANTSYDIRYGANSGWYNSLANNQGQQLWAQQQQMGQGLASIYDPVLTNGGYWYNGMLSGLGSSGLTSTPETAEQTAARVKRELEHQAKRKAASLRAESLLFTILTPAQVRQYTDDACFDVEVNGRVYRLACNSRSGNVTLLEKGKPKFKYCAHPHDAHDVPIPDVLLSQLLMLKSNETEFLRIANRTVLQ